MMRATYENNCIRLSGVTNFSLEQTFDCGQCFRFEKKEGYYEGVALGKLLRISENNGDTLIYGCTLEEYENVWRVFLSLDRDYGDICRQYADGADKVLSTAASYGSGIRILRQDKWEALCSFIISQNNNIPRIKKIIDALCRTHGTPIEFEDNTYYTFPSAEVIASLSVDDLYDLRMGFRAKYVHDAARKVTDGTVDLTYIDSLGTSDAATYLCQINGVGPKVALCTLLFGFDRRDAFPVDVWVKRILEKYYPQGLDLKTLGENAGIAQQYLFYYERCLSEKNKETIKKKR